MRFANEIVMSWIIIRLASSTFKELRDRHTEWKFASGCIFLRLQQSHTETLLRLLVLYTLRYIPSSLSIRPPRGLANHSERTHQLCTLHAWTESQSAKFNNSTRPTLTTLLSSGPHSSFSSSPLAYSLTYSSAAHSLLRFPTNYFKVYMPIVRRATWFYDYTKFSVFFILFRWFMHWNDYKAFCRKKVRCVIKYRVYIMHESNAKTNSRLLVWSTTYTTCTTHRDMIPSLWYSYD